MLHDAIEWIREHTQPGAGVSLGSRHDAPCPEVSGYTIPTLLAVGERALALQYARWLVTVQNPDGSFGGNAAEPAYAFDTGQVVRGWFAVLGNLPEVEVPLRRACDWLLATADASTGRLRVPAPGLAWSLGARGEISEAVHLYCLAPLRWTGLALGERRYVEFADRSIDWYLRHLPLGDFRQPNALSHFFALVQAGLVELHCHDVARRGMAAVAEVQRESGAVPAYADVTWVCSAGVAQCADVWYALGETARADRALDFLTALQNPSGGFLGSYGVAADYFPAEEISWAAKFTIDACARREAVRRRPARRRLIAPVATRTIDGILIARAV